MRRAARPVAPEGEARKPKPPVEQRILTTAFELFRHFGIRGVSIAGIAANAQTNTPTVLKLFGSKPALVAKYVEKLLPIGAEDFLAELREDHPDDPKAQLKTFFEIRQMAVTDPLTGRCDVARVSGELGDTDRAARALIKSHKDKLRSQLAQLCNEAGYSDPKSLSDQLFLLLEGAESTYESMGSDGPTKQLVAAAQTLLAAKW